MKIKKSHLAWALFGEVFGLVVGYVVLTRFLPFTPFVTPAYAQWLPVALNLMVATTVLHIFHHLFKPSPVHHVFNTAATLVSFYSLYLFWVIFPFDFSVLGVPNLNELLKFALLAAFFGLVIALIVNVVTLILSLLGIGRPAVPETGK